MLHSKSILKLAVCIKNIIQSWFEQIKQHHKAINLLFTLYNFHVIYIFFYYSWLKEHFMTIQTIKKAVHKSTNCQSLQNCTYGWCHMKLQPLMKFLHCNWFDIILILKISLSFSHCITIIVVIESQEMAANKRFLINLSQSNWIRRRLKHMFFQMPLLLGRAIFQGFFDFLM